MKRLTLVLLATLLAVPAAASAATVSVDPAVVDGQARTQQIRYLAAPGEANRLVIVATQIDLLRTEVTLTDPGATVTAGAGCTVVADGHTANCAYDLPVGGRTLRAELDDGDDTLHEVPGDLQLPVVGLGGPGDDTLAGGGADDQLDGGGGTDTLRGGEGSDALTDGDTDATANADTLDGGPNTIVSGPTVDDVVSYASRTQAVTADLRDASGAGGAAGEGDVVLDVESARGGAGDDELRGLSILDGGAGDDELRGGLTVRGGPGDDVVQGTGAGEYPARLAGGSGRDTLIGGGGFDELEGGSGLDRLSCGRRGDTVVDPGPRELLPRGCETVELDLDPSAVAFLGASGRIVGPRAARQRAGCPQSLGPLPDFRATLTLRQRGGRNGLVGRGTLPCDEDHRGEDLRLRLTKHGARLARRRKGIVVTIRVRNEGFPDQGWSYRLR